MDDALSTLAVDFFPRSSGHGLAPGLRAAAARQRGDRGVSSPGSCCSIARRMLQRRWLAEIRLAVEKERAQLTLASIGDAVIVTTPDDRVGYMNAAAERLIAAGQDAAEPAALLAVQHRRAAGGGIVPRRPMPRTKAAPQQLLRCGRISSSVPVSVVETPIVHDGH